VATILGTGRLLNGAPGVSVILLRAGKQTAQSSGTTTAFVRGAGERADVVHLLGEVRAMDEGLKHRDNEIAG